MRRPSTRILAPLALAGASAAIFGFQALGGQAERVGCAPVTTTGGQATVQTPDGPVLVPQGLANAAPSCAEAPHRPAALLGLMAPLPRLVQPIGTPAGTPMVKVQVAKAPRILSVPLLRSLKPGDHGVDVRELQRALIRAGVRSAKRGAPGNYGVWTRRQVALVQRRHKISPATGDYGPRAHKALVPFYDARGVMVLRDAYLARHLKAQAAAERAAAVRAQAARVQTATDKLVAYTRWAELNAYRIHYSQGSLRGTYERRPFTLDQWLDCSMYVTDAYAAAGLPDPNGFGYNGYGYTGTLITHGTRVFGVPQAGDLVFYGSPISHVAIATGGGYVSSHGSEPGPLHVRWDYRPPVSIHRYLPMDS